MTDRLFDQKLDDLCDRLEGRYRDCKYPTSPIQLEAAQRIRELRAALSRPAPAAEVKG